MRWFSTYARQPSWDLPASANKLANETSQHAVPGSFIVGSCTNNAGTRAYKLYVPSGFQGKPLPLIVMLHGCKQNPDDFAAGTAMNRLAEQHNCLVVYPSQIRRSNGFNCWNWFNPAHQKRDRGEPSIIADITRQVMHEYQVDPNRVYVAGLSAGGAMAAILAARYPELYAAVGIHSGLPVESAQNVASAFGTMQAGSFMRLPANQQPVPAIVFHGERDRKVHPVNGFDVLAQCLAVSDHAKRNYMPYRTRVVNGEAAQGRAYTQFIYYGDDNREVAEHWLVHDAGHAWSGGSLAGSYTDPTGPDASSEMIRFFLANPKRIN